MPNYGSGNWFGLPELGLTEKLGGNTASVEKVKAANPIYKPVVSYSMGGTVDGSSNTAPQAPAYTPPRSGGITSTPKAPSSPNKQKEGEDNSRREQEEAERRQYDAMTSAINEEFSNIMNTLNSQETSYNEQLPLTEQQITQGYDEVLPQIQQEQSMREADLAGQQQSAESQTGGVLSSARRMYNELLSGAQQYGGSAGQAYGELLGRSTADTMGEAKNNLATTITKIRSELGVVKNFYQSKITDLGKNKNLAIEQARKDYRDQINTINAAKREAEGAKSQRRLQALADLKTGIAQINAASVAAQRAIDQWQAEQQATLQAAQQKAVQEFQLNPTNLSKIGLNVKPGAVGQYSNYMNQGGEVPEGIFYSPYKTAGTDSLVYDPITGQPVQGTTEEEERLY